MSVTESTKDKHKNLHSAKRKKNDEFYTRIYDVEMELRHYEEHLKDKIVFCNCDDPNWSSFVKYFALNFNRLELKKIISTHYEANHSSYRLEITHQPKNVEELDRMDRLPLRENGDFRSPECIELLEECDIVCTNPPFSLFREYIDQLMVYKKNFLIIGALNAATYKDVFRLIKDNKVWLGHHYVKEFKKPDGGTKGFGNVLWYTNLPNEKRNDKIILTEKYNGNESKYPKYDEVDAIEVSKVVRIPIDYDGMMGVPVSFLTKYNPEQFEIINLAREFVGCAVKLNGEEKYARILIKHKVDMISRLVCNESQSEK